jgi:hypothetical protein
MRAPAMIVTPFPSIEEAAAVLGVGKARVARITKLMEEITRAPGRATTMTGHRPLYAPTMIATKKKRKKKKKKKAREWHHE